MMTKTEQVRSCKQFLNRAYELFALSEDVSSFEENSFKALDLLDWIEDQKINTRSIHVDLNSNGVVKIVIVNKHFQFVKFGFDGDRHWVEISDDQIMGLNERSKMLAIDFLTEVEKAFPR